VSTTKAAIEEGVVPAVAWPSSQPGPNPRSGDKLSGDEATGARMVAKAVEAPLNQIAVNAVSKAASSSTRFAI